MPFSFTFDLAQFTPAEAARITRVSTTLQRDWRRRGFLPVSEGHARFDVFALSKMLFLSCMAARGIGPSEAKPYADLVMNAIARAALSQEGAAEGDDYPSPPVWLAHSVVEQTSPLGPNLSRVMSAPIFLVFADGSEWFDFDATAAMRRKAEAGEWEKLEGPVIVLDTTVLGAALAARAGRPLVRVVRVNHD